MSSTTLLETAPKAAQLALQVAYSYQSKQTRLIHYNYSGEHHLETIPLYENACFVLALLRTKERDKISQAKEVITRLLSFEVDGDFPLYLHDYPACHSPSHSVNLAVPFQWMLKRYTSLLGDPLTSSLHALQSRILTRAQEKSLSWNAQMKYAALQNTFDPKEWHPRSPRDWGDFLICCTLTETDASKALSLWNPSLAFYTGGGLFQEKTEPAVSLLDLFLCTHFGLWSKRVQRPHPTHLHASLVFPLKVTSEYVSQSTYTADPFTHYFGDLNELHALTLRSHADIQTRRLDTGYELTLQLPSTPPSPDALELSLFLDHSPAHDIRVDSSKATTFKLEDPLTVTTDDNTLKLTFELIEGTGTFCGHIFHGNRPNQTALKGVSRFATYDWHIALRTIQRDTKATLRVTLIAL